MKRRLTTLVAFVLVISILLLVLSLQRTEVQISGFRTETRLIAREESAPMVDTSENYADTLIEVVLGNKDVENRTMKDLTYTITPHYNVTFEFLNVSKGTFDEATFFHGSDWKIVFAVGYIYVGKDCRGEIWVRLPISKGEGVEVKAKARSDYGFDDQTGAYADISFDWTRYSTDLYLGVGFHAYGVDLPVGSFEYSSQPVPEFPSGESIALGIGMGMSILVVLRKRVFLS